MIAATAARRGLTYDQATMDLRTKKRRRPIPLAPQLHGGAMVPMLAGTVGLFACYAIADRALLADGISPEWSGLLAGAGMMLLHRPVFAWLARGAELPDVHPGLMRHLKRFEHEARDSSDLNALANQVVRALQRAFDPHHLTLWIPPVGEASFHLAAGLGRLPATYVLPEFSLRQLLKERPEGPWIVPDHGEEPPSPFDQLMIQVGAKAVLPLVMHGRLIGLVTLGKRRRGRYGAGDLAAFRRFATAIAEVLTPFQLRAEQAHHLSKLETVSRLYVDAQKKAVTDGLTGLHTHLHFQEQLAKRFFEARRFDQPLSLMFIDADHFKRINDTFGHLTGDEVLKAIADAVRLTARQCDTVARYGGEELAMLLPQTDLAGATILAERLREAISDLVIREVGGDRAVGITASIGVAQLQLGDGTPADLLDRADQALYEAKRRGRNRVMQSA